MMYVAYLDFYDFCFANTVYTLFFHRIFLKRIKDQMIDLSLTEPKLKLSDMIDVLGIYCNATWNTQYRT